MTWLTHLSATQNEVKDVGFVGGLTSIRNLDLYGNCIEDIAPLVTSEGLGDGDHVNLARNPLDRASWNAHPGA